MRIEIKDHKDVKPVRYSYSITSALLLGGAAISLITGAPAGAQVAQNDRMHMEGVVPRAGAPASFADLTAQLQPAVVNISTRQSITVEQQANPFEGTPFGQFFQRRQQGPSGPRTQEATSLGSGFIVSADGYIVTNNHVVAPDARATLEEVTVTLADGTEYTAELVGTDPQSDLAVLKISGSSAFPFVRFGNSSEARVGDWVIAIGNPFGLGGTVTSGIVSSVLRNVGSGAYDRYIQTDAAINRGNSGGPLFDMQGNVIGINNAILSPSGGSVGIGLAIPAETASPIVEQLIRGEEIQRGYLGVSIQPVDDDIADALGIERARGELIQSVQPGEAAERAGLRAGDVVVSVNDTEVTPDSTLSYIVANIAPGTTIPVTYVRDGERRRTNVTVGRRPSEETLRQQQMFQNEDNGPSQSQPSDSGGLVAEQLGIQALPIDPTIARQLGVPADTRGLAITNVDPNSDAARRGLARGVMILAANGREVPTLAALEAVIEAARRDGRGAVLLRVQARGGQPQSIPVRLTGN
ncbi:Do family serine endopeptidase [Aurantiacibacter luteus]|uniref:Probable periplasmic serine endoprotease DegP-like n=1 Tax=Aurantiacibacter luteus TaxID=1581420 RepID=A0A0G9MVF5_9SPHN|nr:Do family serine endopeptidase [Aurantiacibacter luteus]KLE34589.1 protease [Aurantiacibacter luteus]